MQAWLLDYLPLLIVLSSLLPGLLIFTLKEQQVALRTFLNLLGVTLKLLLVFLMWQGVKEGESYYYRIAFLPGADLILQADALSLLFVVLSSVLWLATTIYAIGYLEHSPLRSRFFGYFSLCVSATVGLALAGNLVSFLLFYELLTLATFPLVVHRGTPESLRAGRIYLAYTLGGGTLVLMGVALVQMGETSKPLINTIDLFLQGLFRFLPLGQYPPCVVPQQTPGFGGADGAGVAVEQLLVERLLHQLDLPGNRRRRQAFATGDFGKTAVVEHRHKQPECLESQFIQPVHGSSCCASCAKVLSGCSHLSHSYASR